MKFQLAFTKIVPKPKRERIKVSPQEKFNRLSKRLDKKGNRHKLRKFHFNAIEAGTTIIVFDGDGMEVAQRENSRNGYRDARNHCLGLFFASDNQNGGFSFTTDANLEYQTPEEINSANNSVRRLQDYKSFVDCNSCRFQFETQIEMNKHKCNEGIKGWAIFEFAKVRGNLNVAQ